MPLSRILAALAALCTGLALAAWLVLTVVVGGALTGLGSGPRGGWPTAGAPTAPAVADAPATAPPTRSRPSAASTASAVADAPATAPAGGTAADGGATGTREAGGGEAGGSGAGGGDDAGDAATDGVSRLAVDWPTIPTLQGWTPLTTTASFDVYAEDPDDPVLRDTALRWAPRLEGLLDVVGGRLGRDLPQRPTAVVFAARYDAACPARGLAAPPDGERDVPLVMVFVDADTGDLQVRAVLAHEIAHHLTMDDAFVGDGILTEGIANWAAGSYALAWQGFDSWADAARRYLAQGSYVSVADPNGLVPADGEACIARRDRVYNVRTAFVAWLVERYGLETVLAMPSTAMPTPVGGGDGDGARAVPDYAAATGASLTALERRWLAELTADR